jgi:tyrosine-protein kinase Etk/Wzc
MPNLPVAASHARIDAIDQLSHEILRRHVGRGRRGLTVAGVSDGVGVSSIALGLSQALARVGVNTLLIDADLVSSSLQSQLAPAWAESGLAEVLRGEADIEDVLDLGRGPNLAILHAGACGDDGEARLFTQRFDEVLEWGLRRFQITIVDSPAASRSTAAFHIGRATGYSLLVARRHISFAQDLSLFADQMRQAGAEVVGSVLSG